MLTSRPLLPTRADEHWFVSTEEHERLFSSVVEHRRNTLLLGASGSGKTSALRMLELGLRRRDAAVTFVSFALADDISHATVAVHTAAVGEGWLPRDDAAEERALSALDPYAPTGLIRRLGDAPAGCVMLVDDVPSHLGHAFFGRMRDELWQLDLVWVAAANEDAAGALLRPPADAFFERRVTLRPFTLEERESLVHRRLSSQPERDRLERVALDTLVHGSGYPREVIARAREATEGGIDADAMDSAWSQRSELAERAAGRPGLMALEALEHLGAVSAGDDALLSRLGWTRPHAVAVLGKLEAAGVVQSSLEPRQTPGRPRKLYALKPLDTFVN